MMILNDFLSAFFFDGNNEFSSMDFFSSLLVFDFQTEHSMDLTCINAKHIKCVFHRLGSD